MAYIAKKRIKVKTNRGTYEWRDPGDPVPEVQSWDSYDIEVYIDQNIIAKTKDEAPRETVKTQTLSTQMKKVFTNPMKRYAK
jgi:hypothetical protein